MSPRRLPRITRRRLVWAAVLLAGGLLLALAFRPQPVAVDVAAVDRGPLEVTLDEEGETRVRDRFVVSTPVAGRVLRIELEAGDPVAAGQVLAVVRPADPALLDVRSRAEGEARAAAAAAGLEESRARLQAAEAEARFAAAELERTRRLAGEGIVPQESLDQAVTTARSRAEAVEAARAEVARMRQELEAVRARVADPGDAGTGRPVEVTAPVAGTVLRRVRESEAVVAAGEPLLEIGDPADLEVVTDMLSQDAVRIAPGDPVRIEEWGGDEPLAGRVRRVEPGGFTRVSALGVEEQRVDVVIDLVDPAAARPSLGDAFRVEVRVVTWRSDDVLRLPTGALFRQPDGAWAVFTVAGGRARLTPVRIGHRSDLAAEVTAGLEAGDAVVLHPGDAVTDGARVAVRE